MNCEYCNNMYIIETKPVNSVALDSIQYNQQFTSILPLFPFFPTVAPINFLYHDSFSFSTEVSPDRLPPAGIRRATSIGDTRLLRPSEDSQYLRSPERQQK